MGLLKWVIVVVGSFVGGWIAGLVPATIIEIISPGNLAVAITQIVGWIVGGIFIWKGLVKLMNLRASPPPITEESEDK